MATASNTQPVPTRASSTLMTDESFVDSIARIWVESDFVSNIDHNMARTAKGYRDSIDRWFDHMIDSLTDSGYSYSEGVVAFGTVTPENRYGITDHTNGNHYTLVCTRDVAYPVIYVGRCDMTLTVLNTPNPAIKAIREAIASLEATPPRDGSEASDIARELNELGRELAKFI